MKRLPRTNLVFLLSWWLIGSATQAQQRFEAADSPGVTASREGRQLRLELSDSVGKSIIIPRFAAAIRSVSWQGGDSQSGELNVWPEQDTWIIRWKSRPAGATGIVIKFDSPPKLINDVTPIRSRGDGSYLIPAHFGKTSGEKIRYEPQPHKNTVGYWVGAQDQVTWELQIDTPGEFNVGILQGCGKGQGGSSARIEVKNTETGGRATLDFEVLETGHFQDFQFRHLGTLKLESAGQHTLKIAPIKIKKNALMDVREVRLIRLPDKK